MFTSQESGNTVVSIIACETFSDLKNYAGFSSIPGPYSSSKFETESRHGCQKKRVLDYKLSTFKAWLNLPGNYYLQAHLIHAQSPYNISTVH